MMAFRRSASSDTMSSSCVSMVGVGQAQHVHRVHDGAERVANLVRDVGRHPAEVREPFRRRHLLLHRAPVGDVVRDALHAGHVARLVAQRHVGLREPAEAAAVGVHHPELDRRAGRVRPASAEASTAASATILRMHEREHGAAGGVHFVRLVPEQPFERRVGVDHATVAVGEVDEIFRRSPPVRGTAAPTPAGRGRAGRWPPPGRSATPSR